MRAAVGCPVHYILTSDSTMEEVSGCDFAFATGSELELVTIIATLRNATSSGWYK